jgi:thioesterase domain-containing protein
MESDPERPAKSGRPARMLGQIATVNTNNIGLLERFRPAVFSGDVLLFVATESRDGTAPPENGAQAWSAYVTGQIEDIDVRSDHHSMMTAGPLSEIARVVSARLTKQRPVE